MSLLADRKRSLEAVPVVNPRLGVQEGDNGRVTLVVPAERSDPPRWRRMLFPLPRPTETTVDLDPIGSYVWRLCDGARRVRDIILEVADRYQLARREAEISVVHYLKVLGERGFIGMEMERQDD